MPCPATTAAVDLDRPRVGLLEAGDRPEQRRLAAAGRAEQGDDLAALDLEPRPSRRRRGRSASSRPLETDHRAVHVRRTLPPSGVASEARSTLAGVPLASVYPLVSTRSLARPFTYEVPEGHAEGRRRLRPARSALGARGGRRRRGRRAAGRRAGRRRRTARRGSRPARRPRALARRLLRLDAGARARARRPDAPGSPAASGRRRRVRESLAGEPEPAALTPDQRAAVERIVAALDEGVGEHVLLEGPTGSGKTEVYLQACAAALERGLGTIVLVPEIALAPQTVGRFRQRFGDVVAILHSSLGDAERRDERDRIAAGEARIVVGARSAIFAAMRGVGLIVVDEEHDPAFKQESDPRYDARTVAAKRAALEGAVAVYGSATPRPESWARLRRSSLSARIGVPMPRVRLVDLRREAGYPLSAPLLGALGGLVEDGGRAILLLNRRGRRTGGPLPRLRRLAPLRALRRRADAPLGRRPPLPPLRSRGAASRGVPRVRLRRARPDRRRDAAARDGARGSLPELERIRLDADVSARPGALRDAIERFRNADRAVLIGTQIVAKGHHFPGVALAAVVDADTGLSLPDFRAEERTFQLVTQLAGRSGRDAPGPRARPDVPAGRDAAPARGQPRRRRVPRRGARAARGARLPAVPSSRLDPRLGPRGGGAAGGAAGAPRAPLDVRRRGRPARAGARAPAARAPSRAADRQDDAAALGRAPRLGAPRRGGADDAP